MKRHYLKTYLLILIVFLASSIGVYFFKSREILQAIIAFPGVSVLCFAVWQLYRDQIAFEKELKIQQNEFKFNLGSASKMSTIAFDKHVEFCEKYMSEINAVVHTMFREGETSEVLKSSKRFFILREEYALWITDEMDVDLEKFEQAIQKLGATSKYVERTTGIKKNDGKRGKYLEDNFQLLNEILGLDKDKELNEDYAIKAIKSKVKRILGVEELTILRQHIIQQAATVLRGDGYNLD